LNRLRVGSEVLGCLGPDRFCAMLPGASDTAAAEWAEHVREALAAARFKVQGTTWQITASFGVAGCDAADSAEQLLNLATQALESAKSSGRNCVVRYGEFGADARELIAPAKMFDGTVARGVMTPCTVFLQGDEPVGQAVTLLHQTRLDAIPVVDAEGKFLGLCEHSQVIAVDESQYTTQRVRDVMTTDVQSFGEAEEFASLLDFFTRDERSLAVVVDGQRPIGLITCNSLLAMSKPVTTLSLAPASQYSDTSEYLMVPDLRPLEAEQAVCSSPA
jgi:CBS-domain-containing membrane protein